ncbi:hypothetical protein BST61_g6495 [Cercospora zeina]
MASCTENTSGRLILHDGATSQSLRCQIHSAKSANLYSGLRDRSQRRAPTSGLTTRGKRRSHPYATYGTSRIEPRNNTQFKAVECPSTTVDPN